MIFTGVILSALVMLLLSVSAQCRRMDCKSDCRSFVEGFPMRLKKLCSTYREVQLRLSLIVFLPFPLLNENVQQNINANDPCAYHVMNEILRLDIILPTAVQKNLLTCKTPVDSVGNIFQDLKQDVLKFYTVMYLRENRFDHLIFTRKKKVF
uniref:Interleukin-10 n=2 Tax=Cyprinus carpio TaxID=7962 RepID=A0A9J7Y1D6_CYPCA